MARKDLINGNVWEQYSNKVVKRMNAPKFLGEFSEKDAKAKGLELVVADFGSEACGDSVRLYWLVDAKTDKIIDARFKSFGCGTAIASSDMMAELTLNKTVDEAMKITNLEVEKALRDVPDMPAFPSQKMHCSVMAYDVIIEAAAKYKGMKVTDIKNSEIVCECARVTRKEIEDIVEKHGVKTVEELQKYTDAGTYCQSCVAPGGHEKRSVYLVDIINETNIKIKQRLENNQDMVQKFDNMSLFKKIKSVEKILKEKVSYILEADGGSVELIDIVEKKDNKTEILIKYKKACSICNATIFTSYMIEETLKTELESDNIKVIQV